MSIPTPPRAAGALPLLPSETFAEALPHGICFADSAHRVLYINRRWANWMGVSPAAWLGRDWREAVLDHDRVALDAAIALAPTSQEPVEVELRLADSAGTAPWCLGRLVLQRDAAGTATGRLITLSRIARRKQLEAELAHANVRLSQLERANVIGIVEATADRIVAANDCFLAMVGYTRAEIDAGLLDWQAMSPPEYRQQITGAMAALLATGSCPPFEKEYVRKGGSRVPVLLGAAVLTQAPLRWVCFVLDLSERRRMEVERERMLERERAGVAARDEFLAVIAHDLRTPLTSIRGFAQIAQRRTSRLKEPLAETLRDPLAHIDDKTVQMARFIDELVDQHRYDVGAASALDRGAINLVELVQRAMADIASANPQRQIELIAAELALVGRWDRIRSERLLANLLANAVKYSAPDAPISVAITAQCEADGRWATLQVAITASAYRRAICRTSLSAFGGPATSSGFAAPASDWPA